MKNNTSLRYGLLAILLLFVCMTASGQNWNDMVRWINISGKYRLAELAHPFDYANDKVLGYTVEASSSSVVVKVRYEGFITDYEDTYEIVKGKYHRQPYFRRIRINESLDPFCSAFQSLDSFGLLIENNYLRTNASRLYGGEDFRDLSRGEKAAFALYSSFLKEYSN